MGRIKETEEKKISEMRLCRRSKKRVFIGSVIVLAIGLLAGGVQLFTDNSASAVIRERTWAGEGVKITVLSFSAEKRTGLHVAQKGDRYLYVKIGIYNDGEKSIQVNPYEFTLTMPTGYTAVCNSDSYSLKDCLETEELASGQELQRTLIFYVPMAESYVLNYKGLEGKAQKEFAVFPINYDKMVYILP